MKRYISQERKILDTLLEYGGRTSKDIKNMIPKIKAGAKLLSDLDGIEIRELYTSLKKMYQAELDKYDEDADIDSDTISLLDLKLEMIGNYK